jgi:hypothetical protein
MTQGVGLSIGATNIAAIIPGCATVARQSVLTLYPHRPPEVGGPAEQLRNPPLGERGLVLTDFVDRAADPVGIMAADGTFHRGESLIAEALRSLTYAATAGRTPIAPPGVAFPAHWRPAAVAALGRELDRLPEWSNGHQRLPLISDAAAALMCLHAEPGLPTRGVVALCDFGGTGTSITLADAADGYRPIGPTVRYCDFSGELIDRALLAHVMADLSFSGTADVAGTSAIGALHRLRTECRDAKERLSRGAVTSLLADVPGHRREIRLTRAELDDEIRQPLASFIEVLREHLHRNRIQHADLTAVASVGGGASIPAVTTALSEQLRIPVITTPRPSLAAAEGAALRAVRRPEDDSLTQVATPVQSTQSTTMRALAWSEIDDVPEIALITDYSDTAAGVSAARPLIDFVPEEDSGTRTPAAAAWLRPTLASAGVFAAMVLVGTGAVMAMRNDASAMSGAATTTTVVPGPMAPAAAPPIEPVAATPEEPPGAPSYIKAAPAPMTRVVVSTPPPVIMAVPAPAVAPPPAGNPPPPSAPPASTPATTSPTTPTSPPPSSPPSSPPSPPPSSPPPSSPPSSEPPSSPPPSSPPPSSPPPEPPPSQPPHSEPPSPPAPDEPANEPAEQPK